MASVAVDQNMKRLEPLSAWDVAYSVNMAIACLISYWIMTNVPSPEENHA